MKSIHVEDIPKLISYAFEKTVTLADIQPLKGSDHIKEWNIKEDEDIVGFLAAPTMSDMVGKELNSKGSKSLPCFWS